MSATNQQMTREQLDELMVVAVSMQRDAEKLGERPVAVFAYAVQLALAELQKTRQQLAAVVAENAGLKKFGETLFEMHNALNGSGTGIQGNYEAACQQLGLEAAMDALDEIETPAIDAYLAEVRAQARNEGINYAASRLAAAYNHGFIGKSMSEVADVVHMILDSKADLANDPMPAADGLSGEYAEKSLVEFAAQLRQGATHE